MTSKIEDWIIAHVGTRTSFVLHVLWFGYWIITPVEQFPFGLLTMVVSLEAILLSILIMLSQRRHDIILEAQSKHDKHIETNRLDRILLNTNAIELNMRAFIAAFNKAVDTDVAFTRLRESTSDESLRSVALAAALFAQPGVLKPIHARKTPHKRTTG